jgi:S-adenosylhomocysteine hydrolase
MKNLFIIVLFLSSVSITAQTIEKQQTTDKLNYLYQQQKNLEQDLMAFNSQYKTGTNLIIYGTGFSLITGLLTQTDTGIRGEKTGLILIGTGGLIALSGIIVQIDAHKFLGGKASLTRGGIKIDLN